MKARIDVGQASIDLDGTAAEIAEVIRQLNPGGAWAAPTQHDRGKTERGGQQPGEQQGAVKPTSTEGKKSHRLPDARAFFEEKKPANNREATAAAAYYLKEIAPDEQRSATLEGTVALAQNGHRAGLAGPSRPAKRAHCYRIARIPWPGRCDLEPLAGCPIGQCNSAR